MWVLLNFNSILFVLILFVANLKWSEAAIWHKIVFYVVVIIWSLSNARLMFSLRHIFPTPTEFTKEMDFRLTADLYIRRMGIYNITLTFSIIAFLVLTFMALFPFSIGIQDRIFGTR